MTIETFGTLPDGSTVRRITIADDVLSASFLTWGTTMQSVHLAGVPFSLCIGFDTPGAYLDSGAHVGAILGRVANRIANGRATVDGTCHDLERNERGLHTLHGGSRGTSLQNWNLKDSSPHSLQLTLTDTPENSGLPGTLEIMARVTIIKGGVLEMAIEAQTDAPTLCNLAPHPYFNLNGGGDAREQILQVNASAFCTVDAEKIPTGALDPVFGTARDHREPNQMLATGLAYDHNFCLAHRRMPIRPVATLTGKTGGVTMRVETTEPGLQVYDGAKLRPPFSGIALEPQCWPDAPNHPGFPSVDLKPGTISRQVTRFVFERL